MFYIHVPVRVMGFVYSWEELYDCWDNKLFKFYSSEDFVAAASAAAGSTVKPGARFCHLHIPTSD